MKIVFVSNFFNHHQKPICDSFYEKIGDDFLFIETQKIDNERIKLGYNYHNRPKYVHHYGDQPKTYKSKIFNADFVIFGSAPICLVRKRLLFKRKTFFYSEHITKTPISKLHLILRKLKFFFHFRIFGFKHIYLLCSSAFAAEDYERLGFHKERMYKWGYFPSVNSDFTKIPNSIVSLLWVGRLIDWKHPEYAIKLAEFLKNKGFAFKMTIVGSGCMEDQIKMSIKELNLSNNVNVLGPLRYNKIRPIMKENDIFLFTSTRQEGWGAVLNEAMNSKLAVVASAEAGSTPYLIRDGKNGLIYYNNSFNDFCDKVLTLFQNKEMISLLSSNAFQTINNLWNYRIASCRLFSIFDSIIKGESIPVYQDGPLSKV